MLAKSKCPETTTDLVTRPRRSSKVTKRKSETFEEKDTEIVAKRPTRVRKKRFSADFDYPLDKKLSRSRSNSSNQKQDTKKPQTNVDEDSEEPTDHSRGKTTDGSEDGGTKGRGLSSSQILPGKH